MAHFRRVITLGLKVAEATASPEDILCLWELQKYHGLMAVFLPKAFDYLYKLCRTNPESVYPQEDVDRWFIHSPLFMEKAPFM